MSAERELKASIEDQEGKPVSPETAKPEEVESKEPDLTVIDKVVAAARFDFLRNSNKIP